MVELRDTPYVSNPASHCLLKLLYKIGIFNSLLEVFSGEGATLLLALFILYPKLFFMLQLYLWNKDVLLALYQMHF